MSQIGRWRWRQAMPVVAAFFCGGVVGSVATAETSAAAAPQVAAPAFLIAVSAVPEPGVLAAYSEAAGPLAQQAGIETIASTTDVHVLEGEWPFEGRRVLLDSFTSIDALRDFWYSAEYQEAKKLREGLLDIDFIVAVEGEAR